MTGPQHLPRTYLAQWLANIVLLLPCPHATGSALSWEVKLRLAVAPSLLAWGSNAQNRVTGVNSHKKKMGGWVHV